MTTNEDFKFANDVKAALEQRAPKTSLILILFILALLGAGIIWAQWARVEEVTTGLGRVIPTSHLQVVQTLEGGILRELLVREGDTVNKDQVLMRIDDTGFASKYGELKQQRWSLLTEIQRLEAEATGSLAIDFDQSLEKEVPDLVEAEQKVFDARRAKLDEDISILEQQLVQQKQKLAEFQANEEKLQNTLNFLDREVSLTKSLNNKGVIPEIELLRLERQLADLKGELKIVRASIPGAKAYIQEYISRIQNVEKGFQAQNRERLIESRLKLAIVEEAIKAAQDRVVRAELKAPVNGIVNKVNVTTIGSVVQPGRDIIEIVPVDDTLLIEARIRPQDVAFVGPDQEANVKITAYDYTVYGGLQGRVERISADTITEGENETFYRIMVRTKQNHLNKNGKELPIIPGMVAQVDILTGNKTVLEYLLKPIRKVKNEALRER